jgi:hypothetical protein
MPPRIAVEVPIGGGLVIMLELLIVDPMSDLSCCSRAVIWLRRDWTSVPTLLLASTLCAEANKGLAMKAIDKTILAPAYMFFFIVN